MGFLFDYGAYIIILGPLLLIILGFVIGYKRKKARAEEYADSQYMTRLRGQLYGQMVDIPIRSTELYELKKKYGNYNFQCAFFETAGGQFRRAIMDNLCDGIADSSVHYLNEADERGLKDGVNIIIAESIGKYDDNLLSELAALIAENKDKPLKVFILGSAADYKYLGQAPLDQFTFNRESITAIENLAQMHRGAIRAGAPGDGFV